MTTLIATAPNLLVSAELERGGFRPLGFFSFTPVGLEVLAVEREERFVVRVLGAPEPDTRLRAGDVLLVQDLGRDLARCAEELDLEVQPMQDRHRELLVRDVGVVKPWARIAQVEHDARDFVVLTMPSELEVVAPARRRGSVALSIVAVASIPLLFPF